MTLLVVEVAQVIPAVDSDSIFNSTKSLAIPLTFFDLQYLLFPPITQVIFYKLTSESTRDHFHSSILPKLKLSLSIVLRNFLPLTGRITWDQDEPKPSIIVTQKDALSLTIAETDADFSTLSGYGQRQLSELHTLIPELPVSHDSATILSMQITLFPNHGFSIGFAINKAVLDGKTLSMFLKAWAHSCKQHLADSLPENLSPSFDRMFSKDLTGIDEKIIAAKTNGKRSLMSPIMISRELGDDDLVLATAVLSRDDLQRLRERVVRESPSGLRLSTFVVAYAYTWTCLVKACGEKGGDRPVSFAFLRDFRTRLDPPLPETYFGNCMVPAGLYEVKAATFENERGFVTAAEIINELVNGMSSRKVETIVKNYEDAFRAGRKSSQYGSVAWSPHFKVYESDLGWGRPIKVDIVSIGKERISMFERRDESGGVEIGMCLTKAEMAIVLSLFNNGIRNEIGMKHLPSKI